MELEDDTIDSILSGTNTPNGITPNRNAPDNHGEQMVATTRHRLAFPRCIIETDSEDNGDESGHNNFSAILTDEDTNLGLQFLPHSYGSRLQFSDPAPSEESTVEWDHDIVSSSECDDDDSGGGTTSDEEEDDDQASSSSSSSSHNYSSSSCDRTVSLSSSPPLLEISAPRQRARAPSHRNEDAPSKSSSGRRRRNSPSPAAKALSANTLALIWNAPPLKTSSTNTKTTRSSTTTQGAEWVFPSQGTAAEDNTNLVQAPCATMPIAQPVQATTHIELTPMALPKPQSRTVRWLRSVLRLQKKRTPLEEAAIAAVQAAEAATRASEAAALAAQAATRAAEAATRAAEAAVAQQQQQQQQQTRAPRPSLGPSSRGSRRNFRRRLGRI